MDLGFQQQEVPRNERAETPSATTDGNGGTDACPYPGLPGSRAGTGTIGHTLTCCAPESHC